MSVAWISLIFLSFFYFHISLGRIGKETHLGDFRLIVGPVGRTRRVRRMENRNRGLSFSVSKSFKCCQKPHLSTSCRDRPRLAFFHPGEHKGAFELWGRKLVSLGRPGDEV